VLLAAHRSRALLVTLLAMLLAFVPATESWARGGPPGKPPGLARTAPHEVWALDQGTDLIHIHDSRAKLDEVATIDVSPDVLRDAGFSIGEAVTNVVPHMIEFDSKYRYAFVASTAGGVTIVIDAKSKEVVEVLETIGVADDITRAESGRSIRAGRGTMRGRKYRTPRSILGSRKTVAASKLSM
jgi:hypothetical protein